MPNEDRVQTALLVERLLEGENAQHQIEITRHFRNAAAVPRPDLRADVVDDLELWKPAVRFAASAASHQLAERMMATLAQLGQSEEFCAVTVRASHELMQRAIAGMVCSGTATLEAAFFGLPLCVVYKVAWLTWIVGKQLVRVPFLGMPNVLAGREIARELLQGDATAEALANETLRLVANAEHREALQADLAAVIAGLGERGAAARAADAILEELQTPAHT